MQQVCEPVFDGVILQNFFLIRDTVGLALKFIVVAQALIKRSNFNSAGLPVHGKNLLPGDRPACSITIMT
jgi:hypothetical protein